MALKYVSPQDKKLIKKIERYNKKTLLSFIRYNENQPREDFGVLPDYDDDFYTSMFSSPMFSSPEMMGGNLTDRDIYHDAISSINKITEANIFYSEQILPYAFMIVPSQQRYINNVTDKLKNISISENGDITNELYESLQQLINNLSLI